nr:MAG TPA: hypothetical protein [Caudoviricetes sp.]
MSGTIFLRKGSGRNAESKLSEKAGGLGRQPLRKCVRYDFFAKRERQECRK